MENADKNNFAQLHDSFEPRIRRFIYYRVNDTEMSRDISQQVFLKTWQYIKQPGNRINNPKSFLYKVARNMIVDHYAEKEKRPLHYDEVAIQDLSYQPHLAEAIDRRERQRLIKRQLDSLNSLHKKTLLYRYYRDYSIEEISRALHKSPNYVSVLIHQSTKILKQKVEEKTQVGSN